ncbi:MAG: MalY/PatB family protein [Anaerolineales bacterium]
MKFNFDKEINRHGTNSVKWEFRQGEEELMAIEHTDIFFGPDRTLPMWVADMDFKCPPAVVEAVTARAEHGIYGYSAPTDGFFEAAIDWMARRRGWEISKDWIVITPGVVPALNMLVRTFVDPSEKILIQPPVYYPFSMAVENNQRRVARNPLILEDGQYRMDFDGLEQLCRDPQVKMAILCHPHNPVGRVWTEYELRKFGQICLDNDVLVVSDEIHGDLVYSGVNFTPFASLSPEFEQHSITCTAPSKTFNLAGLHTSTIIVPNQEHRRKFMLTLRNSGLFGAGPFGLVAMEAAYTQGEAWLDQLLEYIEGNLNYLTECVSEKIPQLSVIQPQGTYLVWLDCRKLGLDKMALRSLMLKEAKVYLDEGFIFGPEGEGFERINIACPRAIVVEALDRIRSAVEAHFM